MVPSCDRANSGHLQAASVIAGGSQSWSRGTIALRTDWAAPNAALRPTSDLCPPGVRPLSDLSGGGREWMVTRRLPNPRRFGRRAVAVGAGRPWRQSLWQQRRRTCVQRSKGALSALKRCRGSGSCCPAARLRAFSAPKRCRGSGSERSASLAVRLPTVAGPWPCWSRMRRTEPVADDRMGTPRGPCWMMRRTEADTHDRLGTPRRRRSSAGPSVRAIGGGRRPGASARLVGGAVGQVRRRRSSARLVGLGADSRRVRDRAGGRSGSLRSGRAP